MQTIKNPLDDAIEKVRELDVQSYHLFLRESSRVLPTNVSIIHGLT